MKEWWRAEGHVGICRAFRWYRLHLEKTVEKVHQVLGRDLKFCQEFCQPRFAKGTYIFVLTMNHKLSIRAYIWNKGCKQDRVRCLCNPCRSLYFFNFSKTAVIRICPEQGQWPGQVIWILGISWWQASVQGSPSPYWVLLQSYATSDAISSFFLFPPTVVLCASCSDLFRFVQICSACSAFLWLLLSEATMTRKLRETGDEAIATWPEREPQIESNRNLCHKRNRGIISVVFCRWKLDFTWFYRFTSFCHV